MGCEIRALTADEAREMVEPLIELLRDAVDSGASVGFLPPLEEAEARDYWQGVFAAMTERRRRLLAASENGSIHGAVQLDLEPRPNGSHRAEVMKLFVHRRERRRGIGRALMQAVEDAARESGRSLLVLDTKRGDAAEQLYLSLGYTIAGVIPRYARDASGTLHDTVLFYREL